MKNLSSSLEIYKLFRKHRSVCTDTRNCKPGSIFFALKGERFDANTLAEEALEKGCAYAVVDNEKYAKHPQCLLVEDVLKCLQEIAKLHRQNMLIPLIGITGTNGKTTTKELIKSVLSVRFRTFATEGNLNNHIGVPLSILSIPSNTEIAVIEMGANHVGEIEDLCRICLPSFGIITNIGSAHLEGFESIEHITETKTALYRFIERSHGKLFVNANSSLLLRKTGKAERFLYGNSNNGIYTKVEQIQAESIFLNIRLSGTSSAPNMTEISSKLIGTFNLDNLAAAACVGRYFGLNDKEIKQGIENYTPTNLRSQIIQKKNNMIVADAYNANPSSMQISIDSFDSLRTPNAKGYILGDMLELGKFTDMEHQKIIEILKHNNAENVFLVGSFFNKTNHPKSYKTFISAEKLIEHLQTSPLKHSCLLIKGSHGMHLEKVIEYID